jgi:hypothetical protein
MPIHTSLDPRTSTPTRRRPIRRRPPASRIRLESLEDRCLLSFSPAALYSAGASPRAVGVGDFNGDGRLDLAVANTLSDTAGVLPGNANGTFQPALSAATGVGPRSVAVGDFNGDGKLDLVTANAHDLSVLLGRGDGTFQAPGTVDIGSDPASVAVGDFNGDGKLDLGVTSNVNIFLGTGYASYYATGESRANVLLGTGTGAFPTLSTTSLGSGQSHTSATVADFNGDHKPDFATVDTDSGTARVLLGDGQGNLLAPRDFPIGTYPLSASAGDVNGDGRLDLVTANFVDNNISVLLGDGAGGFAAARNYAVGSLPQSVVLADFNHDNRLDIAAAYSGANDNGVSVLLGAGNGAFSPPLNFAAGTIPWAVAAGDFNGDNWPDAATANPNPNNVSVLLNTRDWSAAPQASSLALSGFPSATTAGQAGSFTVRARNADGTTATGYTGTVHFTSSDGQAGLPADYTFTAADAGLHMFTNGDRLRTAGSQTVAATDTITASVTGNASVVVSPAAARTMTVAGFPSPTTAGVAGTFTVSLKDPYGNIARGYTGTVRFTSSDGKAALPSNYTFTAADAGVHTFRATLKTAGTQSITAKDTANVALSGSEGSITVRPAAARKFLISAPDGVRSGVAFGLTLTVQDGYGNAVTGYTGTIRFTSTDGRASLPANYTFTGANMGVHTFTGLVLRKKCMQKITLADTRTGSLSGGVTESVL